MYKLGLLGVAFLGCTSPVQLNEKPAELPDAGPGDDGVEALPDTDTGEPLEDGGPDPVSDALFDTTKVHEVRVTLPSDTLVALSGTPREYAHADIVLGGVLYEDVGVRLKGNNSFRAIDEKPSFKFKLDEFVSTNRHGRLDKITLNNMIEDPTFSREILSYWLWNDAGMIAPRASYARVYVNDAYYGLYVMLEPMDKAFLKRRFEHPDGDLWEGEGEADFTTAGIPWFDKKAGEGDTSRLQGIAEALTTPTGDYYALADQHFQMDQVIDYWAWMNVTANLDGYPYNLNDFLVYADPAAGGRLVMSPWGMDESWNPAFRFQWGVGVALFNCAADNACLDRVKAATVAALDHFDAADAPAQLQAFYQLSAEAIAEDTRAGWTPLEIEAARAEHLAFVQGWSETLRVQVAD